MGTNGSEYINMDISIYKSGAYCTFGEFSSLKTSSNVSRRKFIAKNPVCDVSNLVMRFRFLVPS